MPKFIPQELTNLAWAYATLEVANEPLMHSIAQESAARITEFKPFNLAIMVWSFAKLLVRDEPVMDTLSCMSQERVQQFGSQESSNAV